MGLKDLATKFGLRTDDVDEGKPTPQVAVSPAPSPFSGVAMTPAVSMSSAPGIIAGADSKMVDAIRASVLQSSPTLSLFMVNCDKMRAAFPTDEQACMRAALVTTGVDWATLQQEVSRVASAALTHAKNGAEDDRKKARGDAVGTLEQESQRLSGEIARDEAEITRLQSALGEKRGRVIAITTEIRQADARLQQQDAVVKASFAEVERFFAALEQTFGRL